MIGELAFQANGLADAMRASLRAQLQPPEDSGGLEESIRVEKTGFEDRLLVKAGGPLTTKNGYDHALAFEFGTQRQPARPFFWNTYRVKRESIRSALFNSAGFIAHRAISEE